MKSILDLPFNSYVGLSLVEFGGKQVVALDPQPHHLNHVGTLHAAALYSLAETGSGHLLMTYEEITKNGTTALLRSSDVKYRKPVESSAYALANVDGKHMDQAIERLQQKGRATIDIDVKIIDKNEAVGFTGTFGWFLARQSRT